MGKQPTYHRVRKLFTGRTDAGPCKCLCCGQKATVLPYPPGEKWATLVCIQCGWYQVPSMEAPMTTEFEVVYSEEITRGKRGKN